MILEYLILIIIKIVDNIISTIKAITQYKELKIISSILVIISQLLFYFVITKVIQDNTVVAIIIVSIASGLGNFLAFPICKKFKKDVKWQYHITSSNIDDMLKLSNYLVEHNIKHITNKGINRHGSDTLNIIIYSKSKEESREIERCLTEMNSKYLKEIIA